MTWRTWTFVITVLIAPSASAQTSVVGLLMMATPEVTKRNEQIISDGLRKHGHRVGESIVIEPRWAHGDITRYPALARELLALRPALIVTPCGPSLQAIREISRTVAIIAFCADEKNFLGEIASLSRPGGFTTGITFLATESVGKRLELLREIVPGFARLAVLYEPDDQLDTHWQELERLQSKIGVTLQRLPVRRSEDLDSAFTSMARERAQAVFIFSSNRMVAEMTKIANLARTLRIASVAEFSGYANRGGLITYGGSIGEFQRNLVMYIDRILKGAKPGDLPVLQPTQFELVVNLKTAREIGITIPQSILIRTDRVVE
jgi:putative ABC transport system substrate-binding protein